MKTLPEHCMKNELTKNELIELTRMGTMESTNEIPYFVPPKEILTKKEIDLKESLNIKLQHKPIQIIFIGSNFKIKTI